MRLPSFTGHPSKRRANERSANAGLKHPSGAHAALGTPAGRSVLLLDDEPAVRIVTGRLMAELGKKVLTADRGTQAFDVFREHGSGIDLIVLDLTMPGHCPSHGRFHSLELIPTRRGPTPQAGIVADNSRA